jgi:anaerobic dimethyl sulfoxide reductase subunit A
MTAKDDGVRGRERLESPIRMIFSLAGNLLINQHSNVNRTKEILRDTSKCEFIVCSDLFMTSSAKFADILLPGTSMFENENITTPWQQGDYLLYCNKVVKPLFESRFEFDWLREVGAKMGIGDELTEGHTTLRGWLKSIYETVREAEPELPNFETFRANGGYQYRERKSFVAFERQIADPANNPFPTPSGKIELFSKRLYDLGNSLEIPALPKYTPSFEGPQDLLTKKYPLQLIAWHTKVRAHSIHSHNDWMSAVERQVLWINPLDAKKRGVSEEDNVEIWNDRGRIRIPAHVTNRVIPGVVAVAQGAWYNPTDDGVDIGGSINVLTTSRPTPLAKGNPQHTNLVEVGVYGLMEPKI